MSKNFEANNISGDPYKKISRSGPMGGIRSVRLDLSVRHKRRKYAKSFVLRLCRILPQKFSFVLTVGKSYTSFFWGCPASRPAPPFRHKRRKWSRSFVLRLCRIVPQKFSFVLTVGKSYTSFVWGGEGAASRQTPTSEIRPK